MQKSSITLRCGLRLDLTSATSAHELISGLVSSGRGGAVHLCNSYTVALAARDPHYLQRLNNSELNLIDGTPLLWLAKAAAHRAQTPTREFHAVRGPDLFRESLTGESPLKNFTHHLIGGDESLAPLQQLLAGSERQIRYHSVPYFTSVTAIEEHVLDQMSNVSEGILWIGLGTPKQDHVAEAIASNLGLTAVAVGAAFDFLGNRVREAPRWIQGTGLEWLSRTQREPRRMFPRYASAALAVGREIISRR